MTLAQLVASLNGDLKNEYKHMLFYMHAANVLVGKERAFFVDKLKAEANSEMGHVFEFAHKIRGWGGVPICGLEAHAFPTDLTTLEQIVDYAIEMEREVIANYHERHAQAEALHAQTGKHYDIVIFLEEQIEHSQTDVDEFVQMQAGWK